MSCTPTIFNQEMLRKCIGLHKLVMFPYEISIMPSEIPLIYCADSASCLYARLITQIALAASFKCLITRLLCYNMCTSYYNMWKIWCIYRQSSIILRFDVHSLKWSNVYNLVQCILSIVLLFFIQDNQIIKY